ncbi:hypothetical protein BDC45DRAFT_576185 [Circinella umbellata]|nr:hypothetical protein BDC45DRAFT_576185 [Circinella umbellata]
MNNNNNNNNPLSGIRDVNVSKLIQLYNNDMYLNNTFFKIVTRLLKKRPVEDSLSSPPPTHHSSLPRNHNNNRNHPHQDHTSPRQQPSSSSHQPLEGMLDPRMPSLHTAFLNNNDNDNDNSTSRFRQNTFADRGVLIPTTRRNSALSSSTPSTTEQRAGRKKKGKNVGDITWILMLMLMRMVLLFSLSFGKDGDGVEEDMSPLVDEKHGGNTFIILEDFNGIWKLLYVSNVSSITVLPIIANSNILTILFGKFDDDDGYGSSLVL